MRRLTFVALALAAACGREVQGDPAPLDAFYRPTGIAFHDGALLVASSNFDLAYVGGEGGTVIAVDPLLHPTEVRGGTHVSSFTGDLAVSDAGCGATRWALVASRYSNVLFQLTLGTGGAPSCDPATPCEIPLEGAGSVADPLAVTAVCAGHPRAFVAYLRSSDGRGHVSEYDLVPRAVEDRPRLRSSSLAAGPVRAFAYDQVHDRLWMAVLATSVPSPLTWVELGGDCRIDVAASDGGCIVQAVTASDMPVGLEVRGIAFANQGAPGQSPAVRRVYLTGRRYDVGAAATAGGRTVDLGGSLVVADLVENSLGRVDLNVVRTIPIGRGAGEIRVLPARPGMRDVVAALATDDGELWLYDDETFAVRVFGRNGSTGAPVLGHLPYSIAIDPTIRTDPITLAEEVRIYATSFQESFVTPIDVPLDDPEGACMLDATDTCVVTDDDPAAPPRRISGGGTP